MHKFQDSLSTTKVFFRYGHHQHHEHLGLFCISLLSLSSLYILKVVNIFFVCREKSLTCYMSISIWEPRHASHDHILSVIPNDGGNSPTPCYELGLIEVLLPQQVLPEFIYLNSGAPPHLFTWFDCEVLEPLGLIFLSFNLEVGCLLICVPCVISVWVGRVWLTTWRKVRSFLREEKWFLDVVILNAIFIVDFFFMIGPSLLLDQKLWSSSSSAIAAPWSCFRLKSSSPPRCLIQF